MSTFYFIRHGETNDIANKIVQSTTSELSNNGIMQVQEATKYIETLPIDKILCSPILRAKQTAEILNNKLQKEIIFIDELQEEKRPSKINGKDKKDPEVVKIINEVKLHYTDPQYRHSDEDTFEILKTRAVDLQAKLSELPDANYLVVTHGTIRRMYTSLVLFGNKLSAENFVTFGNSIKVDILALCIFQLEKDIWKLYKWNLPTI